MKSFLTLLAVPAVMVLTACAAPAPVDPNAPQAEEPTYRTGSTIPRRSKASSSDVYSMSREELERARQMEIQRAPSATKN